MQQKLKVSVCMITYGHEKYIRDAIEGVLMQECDFEVELILANDCSPDKTDEIIQNILIDNPIKLKIKYFHNEKNLGMTPNFVFALQQATGKYIALCEGDDYWTDPFKLQKQVDFLEANQQAAGCFHHASLVNENDVIINEIYNPQVSNLECYNQEECLTILGSSYATCSLVFRSEVLEDLPKVLTLQFCDELLDIVITEKGLLCFLNFKGACYRSQPTGVWTGRQEAKFNLIMYKRVEVLYKVPVYKKKYASYLKTKFLSLGKGFLFSNSIARKIRVFYFFKTLRFLNYNKKETYSFLFNFLVSITEIKKIYA